MYILEIIAIGAAVCLRQSNKTGVRKRCEDLRTGYIWALVIPFSFLIYLQVALGVVGIEHFIDSNIVQVNRNVTITVLFKNRCNPSIEYYQVFAAFRLLLAI